MTPEQLGIFYAQCGVLSVLLITACGAACWGRY